MDVKPLTENHQDAAALAESAAQSPADDLPLAGRSLAAAPPNELPPVDTFNGRALRRQPVWKRSMDFIIAAAGLLVLSPLFLILAVLIKCVSSGPVFFRQERVGMHGIPFGMWKFRTMHIHHDPTRHQQYVVDLTRSNQTLCKIHDHDQLIPGADWLRRLCLDELPQLFNVLIGQMSVVGPRPDVVPITAYDPWQRERFDVLPGMTGLWQVMGKNSTTFDRMMRLDVDYVRRRSLGLDLKILFLTLPTIYRECRGQA